MLEEELISDMVARLASLDSAILESDSWDDFKKNYIERTAVKITGVI